MRKHNFETAFFRYASALDRRRQSATCRGWVSRELSGEDASGAFVLRLEDGSPVARVKGRRVSL
jgi:hypothetical protein